jgi:hypothetical protein
MEDVKDIMLHKLDVKIFPTQQMIVCVTNKSIQHLYILIYIFELCIVAHY